MLIEAYIEALLVDEELADIVWELWNARLIPDDVAAWAWWSIFVSGRIRPERGTDAPISTQIVNHTDSRSDIYLCWMRLQHKRY